MAFYIYSFGFVADGSVSCNCLSISAAVYGRSFDLGLLPLAMVIGTKELLVKPT